MSDNLLKLVIIFILVFLFYPFTYSRNIDFVNENIQKESGCTENALKESKVVYLTPNFVNGKNVLTQNMINKANTEYIIQYDYDLCGNEFTIPDGCVLHFAGGMLTNGALIGNNSIIEAGLNNIFGDTKLRGTWSVKEFYPEWFGAIGNGVEDDTSAINNVLNLNIDGNLTVYFTNVYKVSPDVIEIKRNNVLMTSHFGKILTASKDVYRRVIYSDTIYENITVENLTFDNTADGVYLSAIPQNSCNILYINANNLIVKKCKFYFYGIHAIVVVSSSAKNVRIEDNSLYFTRKGERYDCSGIYINCVESVIQRNYIDGQSNENDVFLYGGIEAHGDMYSVCKNIIKYCHIAINLVNHDNYLNSLVQTNGNEPKTASENHITDVRNGIILWGIKGSNPMNNIKIYLNNIILAEDGACGFGIQQDSKGTFKDLEIFGNSIEWSGKTAPYPQTYEYTGLINFVAGEMENVKISNNRFVKAHRHAIYISPKQEGIIYTNIDIVDNTFVDCSTTLNNTQNSALNEIYSYDLILCDNVRNLRVNSNSFIFSTTISLLNYLVSIYNNCPNSEILNNNVVCTFVNSEGLTQDIAQCKIDLSNTKTDMIPYIDKVKSIYVPNVVIASNDNIPIGTYHKGDTIVGLTKYHVILGTYYKNVDTTSGLLSKDYPKRLYVYSSRRNMFKVGDVISIANAIGGSEIKHTISKVWDNYITFAEDIELYNGIRETGVIKGYANKEDVITIPITAN